MYALSVFHTQQLYRIAVTGRARDEPGKCMNYPHSSPFSQATASLSSPARPLSSQGLPENPWIQFQPEHYTMDLYLPRADAHNGVDTAAEFVDTFYSYHDSYYETIAE